MLFPGDTVELLSQQRNLLIFLAQLCGFLSHLLLKSLLRFQPFHLHDSLLPALHLTHALFHLSLEFRVSYLIEDSGIVGLVYLESSATFRTDELFHSRFVSLRECTNNIPKERDNALFFLGLFCHSTKKRYFCRAYIPD